MRVISGKYKGKNLQGFNINGTRPTMDRVKESLFAMIQNHLSNSIVLDLFAGSGSLGIEALSNGSHKAYFIDNNSISINTIKKNLQNINEEYTILKQDYISALQSFKKNNITFDIIFLDPPYQMHLISKAIQLIEEYSLLNKDGLIVCEYEQEAFDSNYTLVKEKKYGSKNIRIYQREE